MWRWALHSAARFQRDETQQTCRSLPVLSPPGVLVAVTAIVLVCAVTCLSQSHTACLPELAVAHVSARLFFMFLLLFSGWASYGSPRSALPASGQRLCLDTRAEASTPCRAMRALGAVVSPGSRSLIEQGLLLSRKKEMTMPLWSILSVSSALCVLQPSRPFQNVRELVESAVAVHSPRPGHTQRSQRPSCRPSCSRVPSTALPRGAPRPGATTPPSGGGQGAA